MSSNNSPLAGRRALVTGGSRGIGEGIAVHLASMGASLLLAADDAEGLANVKSTILEAGGEAETQVVDLLDKEAVEELGRSAADVDILVNNAAPGQGRTLFSETPDEDWDLQLELILRVSVRLMRSIGPRMVERGWGSIVNISSGAVVDGSPQVAPYAAAKAALEAVTRVAALEYGAAGVRVNAVRPSFTPTARNGRFSQDAEFLASRAKKVPLGRIATTSDIAEVVAWLSTDAAGFITGQSINVDGGATAGTWRPSAP
ncbi:SDR family NAD(P)-dependent oxidoreductase [Rhodococcus sp. WAY2]|uniref:SDR family NAD(P)-dependent oxidoreductase n=1 Tax=Rhodococcus sp. WAY2 TaxID=2663121 RepID=UPI00131F7055|nr:SDR family oxidoreductase [Rhodococcus sp. WAY2]QHE73315.1 3-oxoacyl-[acyl-carrier protein] reductase [Rhodococcus sp. WAY2]